MTPEAIRVSIAGYPVGCVRSSCDRCSSRARYCGLGGTWCPGCWSTRKRDTSPTLEQAAHLLSIRYGLDCWEQVVHSLADADGFVRIRHTAAPVAGLYYHPSPASVVDAVLDSAAPHQRAQLHLQTINRALWGVALMWGEELQDYPRDGAHSPEALPWGLIRWAEGDLRAYKWLITVALRLRSACERRFGKNCKAGRRVGWLVERTHPPMLTQRRGHLSAPTGCLVLREVA